MDDAGQIVADHFGQDFIRHGQRSLRSQRFAELSLHGTESRFDVAPLVVVPLVVLFVEAHQMVHLLESSADPASSILPECRIELSAD